MDFNPIYDPSWTRLQQWENALDAVEFASSFWKMPKPVITPTAPPHSYKYGTGGTHFGLMIPPNKIWVNVPQASTPVKLKGRAWSYPGYKIDRTCSGILAHEFGHLVAEHTKMDAPLWREIVKKTKPVTGYEPVPSEAWAESFRIFFWNPNLLRIGRPDRYEFINLYFEPLHPLSWEEVLQNAPAFIKEYAKKFCLGDV